MSRRVLTEAASVILVVVLLIWSLTPVYNMLLIALDRDEGDIEFEGIIWPPDPSLHSFYTVVTQGHWLLEDFWHQFGNSFFIGLMTMVLTVAIGSLASFAFGRMHVSTSLLLVNAPLLTYAVPASFLVIPFYRLMASYGLSNSLWAIVAANVTFATPYAILILRLHHATGINHLIMSVQWPGMPQSLVLDELSMLAEEVFPRVRRG